MRATTFISPSSGAFFSDIPTAAKVGVIVGLVIATLGAAISMAPWEVAESGVALSAIFLLLWRNSDPPVLLLPPLFQWTEVAIVPLSTIWKRQPLNSLSPFGANLEAAALFGLLGIVCLAFGLKIAMGRTVGIDQRLRKEVSLMSFDRLFRVSISLMVGGYLIAALLPFAGPAREFFHYGSNLRYVGFFMLAYWCLVRRQQMEILGLVVAFEIVFGMTGFFADFKYTLLALFVAALSARSKLTVKDAILISVSITLLFMTAIFWSEVKPTYRAFVNEGSGGQVVLVPISDRIDFLAQEAASFDLEKVADGFNILVARHGYIDYLARAMEFVPNGRPYENGGITLAVIQHISIPRVLYPSKPQLPSDSDVTAKYTGGDDTLGGSNTSISLGYLAELYADFGYFGALIAATVIGMILGLVYRFLNSSRQTPALVTVGLTLVPAFELAYFGTAYVKIVGGMLFASAVCIAIQRFGGLLFARQLIQRGRARR